ncbi:hypothetical protein M422DRAFT_29632 [Sphaerobolus stellatus SS14]|uniref:Serine protease n=1 Tax=Sphaerobolus stellatus (strain SS14) TaxID=990650 RepID=A0A0C9URJ3_SPHS4|nr:hypothetical protein M422DRAFT_29632 [Sphaerobolus stellatus SS14]
MLRVLQPRTCRASRPVILRRTFAQAVDGVAAPAPEQLQEQRIPRALDAEVLGALNKVASSERSSFLQLLEDYYSRSHTVLDTFLKYESTPDRSRRVDFEDEQSGILGISHVLDHGTEHKITFCSGFALHAEGYPASKVIVTCAHTVEEMLRSRVFNTPPSSQTQSGTLIFHREDRRFAAVGASRIVSCLPKSDLVLFTANLPLAFRTLPVSPYPVHAGTRIRTHCISEKKPQEDGWKPWVNGTWSKWVHGEVIGYRDFAGRRAEPGTYDALSHMLFNPPPSSGSSGGPIVDEASGAVVGVVVGTRMDSRVEGVRGWGVPAEAIFEVSTDRARPCS